MILNSTDQSSQIQVEHHAEMHKEDLGDIASMYSVLGQIGQSVGATLSYDSELIDIMIRYGNNPDGIPAIHYAIKMGDERAVELLLDHGANPLAKDHRQHGCLHYAIQSKSLNLVQKFVFFGCDINDIAYFNPPFMLAISIKENEIAKYLFSQGAEAYPMPSSDYDDAISTCCSYGNYNMLVFLVESGVKVLDAPARNLQIPKNVAACLRNENYFIEERLEKIKCLKYLVDKRLITLPNNAEAYYQVTGNTYPEALEYLLDNHHFSPNDCFKNGCPILFYAALNRNFGIEFVEILIKRGVNVKAKGSWDHSILYFIAPSSQLTTSELERTQAIYSLLIKSGADLDGVLNRVTDSNFRKWLIQRGAK